MVVGTADIKLQSSDILAGLKHGNRIMQVLLSKECQVKGFDELIVFREDGSLVEAIASNILVVLDEKLVTPAKPDVAGVGLQWVKSQQIPLEFCRLSLNELRKASEILLINSVAGVRPVRRWEDQTFEVGEMCHRLQNLWNQMLP